MARIGISTQWIVYTGVAEIRRRSPGKFCAAGGIEENVFPFYNRSVVTRKRREIIYLYLRYCGINA